MAWIEFHQELPRHPKTDVLMDEIGVSRAAAVGHISMSWLWALEFAIDGFIPAKRIGAAARGADWAGDPMTFAGAMVAAGWWDEEDGGYRIHNWEKYIGKLLEKRRADAERKAKERDGKAASKAKTKAVRRTSDGHPRDGAGKPTYTNHDQPTDQEREKDHDGDDRSAGAGFVFTADELSKLAVAAEGLSIAPDGLTKRIRSHLSELISKKQKPASLLSDFDAFDRPRKLEWYCHAMAIARGKADVPKSGWVAFAAGAILRHLGAGSDLLEEMPDGVEKVVQMRASTPYPDKPWGIWWTRDRRGTTDEKRHVQNLAEREEHYGAPVEVAQAMALYQSGGVSAACDYIWEGYRTRRARDASA